MNTTKKHTDQLSDILENMLEVIQYGEFVRQSSNRAAAAMLASMLEAERKRILPILEERYPSTYNTFMITLDYPNVETANRHEWSKAEIMVVDDKLEPIMMFGDNRLRKFVLGLEGTGDFELDRLAHAIEDEVTIDAIAYYLAEVQ